MWCYPPTPAHCAWAMSCANRLQLDFSEHPWPSTGSFTLSNCRSWFLEWEQRNRVGRPAPRSLNIQLKRRVANNARMQVPEHLTCYRILVDNIEILILIYMCALVLISRVTQLDLRDRNLLGPAITPDRFTHSSTMHTLQQPY